MKSVILYLSTVYVNDDKVFGRNKVNVQNEQMPSSGGKAGHTSWAVLQFRQKVFTLLRKKNFTMFDG